MIHGIRAAAEDLTLIESVQYVWNGQNYCWYEDGWKGPGWYVCAHGPWVSGLWWGGAYGWHNWHWHGEHHDHGGKHHNKGHHVEHHGGKHHKQGHHVEHHGGKKPNRGHQVQHHGGGKGKHHGGARVSHHGGGKSMHRGGGGRGGGGRGGGGRRSDIRLKQDIVPLARLNNGLELYRFRYRGNDRTAYVGVMAQEVQKIEPSAVWRDRDGYLMVNYDRLGLKFMTWNEWLARANHS
jgi:hypothetical protein